MFVTFYLLIIAIYTSLLLNYISIYIIIIIIIFNHPYNTIKCITLYVVFSTNGKGGPYSLSKYIKRAISKWNNSKYLLSIANLIYKESLSFALAREIIKKKNTYIWYERKDFIELTKDKSLLRTFKKILYGPIVTPINWFNIPKRNTYESYWCNVMRAIGSYIVHSERVKYHIINKSKCLLYNYKYIILKPCIETYLEHINIKSYNDRSIDFLIYIKYSDINKDTEEKKLIDQIKSRYSSKVVRYGNHTKNELLTLANNSKFIIYYSFYDTGALSLLEMKLMGGWPISHQPEFIEPGFGSYVKELESNKSKFLDRINNIYNIFYDPLQLSNNVINKLNCVNSLLHVVSNIKQINS